MVGGLIDCGGLLAVGLRLLDFGGAFCCGFVFSCCGGGFALLACVWFVF